MRLLLVSIFIGLSLGISGFFIPERFWTDLRLETAPVARSIDKESFSSLVQFELNHERSLERLSLLECDLEIQHWVESKMEIAKANTPSAIDSILESMQEAMPTVHAAAAYLTYAEDEAELIGQIADWHRGIGREATHLSTVPFLDPDSGRLGCFTVSIRKLPRFSPRLLDKEVELFYNVCVHCDTAHAGRVPPSRRSVVFACPHCERPFDAYAMDNSGHYRRVTGFLSHFNAPQFDPAPESPLEEMYCIWYAVATRLKYTEDIIGTDGPSDYWQDSMQSFNLKNGDCEDSSILLADWLISRGIPARVATGKTGNGEGHAWCVAQVDGTQYLLETTMLPDPQNPPYTTTLASEYKPRYLFDREKIYFLTEGEDDSNVSDYWRNSLWLAAAPHPAPYAAQEPLASHPGEALPAAKP